MGRYTGPKGKLSRREGVNLFLKGARSFSDKNAVARRPFPPGQHGGKRRIRLSGYGRQLREKQKVKRIYGLRERQFKNLFKEASRRARVHATEKGDELLRLLAMRLDNIVYLLGLAPSRAAARQYVVHKHIEVDGKVLNIPSYEVKVGQKITLKNVKLAPTEVLVNPPAWLKTVKNGGEVLRVPNRDDFDEGIKENLIIEFYSR